MVEVWSIAGLAAFLGVAGVLQCRAKAAPGTGADAANPKRKSKKGQAVADAAAAEAGRLIQADIIPGAAAPVQAVRPEITLPHGAGPAHHGPAEYLDAPIFRSVPVESMTADEPPVARPTGSNLDIRIEPWPADEPLPKVGRHDDPHPADAGLLPLVTRLPETDVPDGGTLAPAGGGGLISLASHFQHQTPAGVALAPAAFLTIHELRELRATEVAVRLPASDDEPAHPSAPPAPPRLIIQARPAIGELVARSQAEPCGFIAPAELAVFVVGAIEDERSITLGPVFSARQSATGQSHLGSDIGTSAALLPLLYSGEGGGEGLPCGSESPRQALTPSLSRVQERGPESHVIAIPSAIVLPIELDDTPSPATYTEMAMTPSGEDHSQPAHDLAGPGEPVAPPADFVSLPEFDLPAVGSFVIVADLTESPAAVSETSPVAAEDEIEVAPAEWVELPVFQLPAVGEAVITPAIRAPEHVDVTLAIAQAVAETGPDLEPVEVYTLPEFDLPAIGALSQTDEYAALPIAAMHVSNEVELPPVATQPTETEAPAAPQISIAIDPPGGHAAPAKAVEAPKSILPRRPVRQPWTPTEWNTCGVDYRRPMPWPKVRGNVIDFHCHLFAARHARTWFETAAHFGIDTFVTMSPLEECVGLARDWPGRIHFIAVPQWFYEGPDFISDWLRRIEAFYNLGSRMAKFHMAPQTLVRRGLRLDSPELEPVFRELRDRGMMVMTHMGDPELWYRGKYADTAKYGTRDEHYKMWEDVLSTWTHLPWVGAHLGGNPEDLQRLQGLLDRHPNLSLDCSATRWISREVSARRDDARDFFIRNSDRILFGSDQVSGDDRGFDFLASRWWTHRKLWETAYIGPMPIQDPDLPADAQPQLRGLALPDEVLQKLYHDNAVKVMAAAGVKVAEESPAVESAA